MPEVKRDAPAETKPLVDSTEAPTITLGKHLRTTSSRGVESYEYTNRTGPTCDVFRGMLDATPALKTPGLILKMTDLECLPESGRWPNRRKALEELADEVRCFNAGASVQGKALPRLGGLFCSGTLYCLVFEDAGRLLTWKETGSRAIKYVLNSLLTSDCTPGRRFLLRWKRFTGRASFLGIPIRLSTTLSVEGRMGASNLPTCISVTQPTTCANRPPSMAKHFGNGVRTRKRRASPA